MKKKNEIKQHIQDKCQKCMDMKNYFYLNGINTEFAK